LGGREQVSVGEKEKAQGKVACYAGPLMKLGRRTEKVLG